MNEKVQLLKDELENQLLNVKNIKFKPNKEKLNLENICGRLINSKIDSVILDRKNKGTLLELCKLEGKKLSLDKKALDIILLILLKNLFPDELLVSIYLNLLIYLVVTGCILM
jgi:hypothetical protein